MNGRVAMSALLLPAVIGFTPLRAQPPAAPSPPKPELVFQVGHLGLVCSLAFSSDSRWLFAGGGAQGLTVWDVVSGRLVRTLPGAGCPIAFSPDGRSFATGEEKGVVKLWDAATWREIRSMEAQAGFANVDTDRLRFSPDGRLLAALSPGGTFRLWDTATGRFAGGRRDEAAEGLIFGPDGRWVVTFRAYGRISLWETAPLRSLVASRMGQETMEVTLDLKCSAKPSGASIAIEGLGCGKREIQAHASTARRVAFSQDGRLLASSGDRVVKIWDVASGRELQSFAGHTHAVNNLNFSPDGRRVVSSDFESIQVWEASSGRLIHNFRSNIDLAAGLLVISPDGLYVLAATPGRMHYWEIANGKALSPLHTGRVAVGGEATSPDARWSASGRSSVTLTDRAAKTSRSLTGYPADIGAMAISPGGRWLAWTSVHAPVGFEGGDSSLRVWDLTTGQLAHRVRMHGPLTVAASPKGQLFAVGSYEHLDLINPATGQRIRTIAAQKRGEEVNPIAFSPDGRQIATKAANYTLKLWDTGSGEEIRSVKPPGTLLRALSFSPDGKVLAAGTSLTWTTSEGVFLLDSATGNKLGGMVAHYPMVNSVAFSPDGKYLASAGRDALVRLWDVASRRELLVLKGHGGDVPAIAFSPDGRLLASGSFDTTVKLWDVAAGHELRTLAGHTSGVRSVAFTPDGRWVFSAAGDRTAVVWDAATGEQAAVLSAVLGGTDWIVMTPDGLFDGTPRALQLLVAWRFGLNDTAPPEIFFSEFYHPGLLADILGGRRPKAPRDIARLDRRQPEVKLALAGGQPAAGPVGSRTVTIRVEVGEAPTDSSRPAGSGARDLRLFRNGSLVRAWRGDVLEGRAKATVEATVPIVTDENRFTAYAFNKDNIKSADAELIVSGAKSLKRQGTAYVLAVGVNQYANRGFNLAYAVADARAFAEELARQQVKLGEYAKVEVVTLFDKDATKANLLAALRRLSTDGPAPGPKDSRPAALAKLQPAQPEDAVFVHFAGHGVADGPRFYLIPHDMGYAGARVDIDEAGFNKMLQHSISDRDLELAFEKIDAGHVLLVIDACNSGQALETEERRRGPMNSKGLAQLAYEKGMYVLTAAQSYQAALEAVQLGHGYLTYALVVEGLKGGAADSAPRDGSVIMREWLDYATLRVPQMQEQGMLDARKLGRNLAIVEGEEKIEDPDKRSLQRPRVFYRRQPEAHPLIVAKP